MTEFIIPDFLDETISVGIVSSRSIDVIFHGEYEKRSEEHGDTTIYIPKDYNNCSFSLTGVKIGVDFHWERVEEQRFVGSLKIVKKNGLEIAINILKIEDYLLSVISSEMSAYCSVELLKAHAVISRSWVVSRIVDYKNRICFASENKQITDDGYLKWYGGESHSEFVVCADDHCQRYQGVTRAATPHVRRAIELTKGEVLCSNGNICDARYSKCCGGAFEKYSSCWEDKDYDYLSAGRDLIELGVDMPDLTIEENAVKWISSVPDSFCNTDNKQVLSQILNSYDTETKNFFRWRITYSRDELSEIINRKSGYDFGLINELIPVERGVSGRIVRLRIIGEKLSLIIGKELEIRRILSHSHLYSSAFYVERSNDDCFILHGAGWGHGVGLCQIGAAIMGERGYKYKEILTHYYPSSVIRNIHMDKEWR